MNGSNLHSVKLSITLKVSCFIFLFLIFSTGYSNEPPLNNGKLTDKDIAQMELRLFNELQVRMHMGKGGWGWERRYKLIKDMEEKGYELAGLALRLFPFLGQANKFDEEAYEKLRDFADSKNAGAACLFAEAITYWNRKKEPQAQKDKKGRARYVQFAADKNQARCVSWVAGWYNGGRGAKKRNIYLGKELFLKGAMLGYQQTQLSLAFSYLNGKRGYPKDYVKAFCWFEVAKRADTGAIRGYKPYIYGLTKRLEDDPPEFYLDPDTFCEQPIHVERSACTPIANMEVGA